MGLAHQVSHMFRGKNIYIYIQLQTHVSLVNPDLVAITETKPGCIMVSPTAKSSLIHTSFIVETARAEVVESY